MKPRLLKGFTATVDHVIYYPELISSSDRPYSFIYFITIHNKSDVALTVKGRKWIVREEGGQVIVVEGDGVVGSFPYLEPGESFSYNSCHKVGGCAMAEGAYLAITDEGTAVIAKIPPFELALPE
ncbi:MAG: magnesium transporter [Verrucomicrobia bacterium RIFCSPHIGHO2_12_FULL_41_10]|nr:MAG: magnesium transporter [Verrucomicrobia bacterium RIFCSPHIGHO2_12_FULL_41_10]HLB34122.1 ApaG domain [Chthoniobacterales bacterium]